MSSVLEKVLRPFGFIPFMDSNSKIGITRTTIQLSALFRVRTIWYITKQNSGRVWLEILSHLSFNDLRSCRLISWRFNSMATPSLRSTHRPLVFGSTRNLEEFGLIMSQKDASECLFSKFQFNLPKLTPRDVTVLDGIVEGMGCHARELRFMEPPDMSWRDDAFFCSYAKCLNILLDQTPNLTSLKLNIYDYRLPLETEHVLPPSLPHLRKLKIRLMFGFGTGEGEKILSKLIQASPRLHELSIHPGPLCYDGNEPWGTSKLLERLPELLNKIPARCTVGLSHLTLSDKIKRAIAGLRRSKIRIFSATVYYNELTDPEAFELFWRWMERQPIRKLGLEYSGSKTDYFTPAPSSRPFKFGSCRKLSLLDFHCPLIRNGHFLFPNLQSLKLDELCEPKLDELLGSTFPQVRPSKPVPRGPYVCGRF